MTFHARICHAEAESLKSDQNLCLLRQFVALSNGPLQGRHPHTHLESEIHILRLFQIPAVQRLQ